GSKTVESGKGEGSAKPNDQASSSSVSQPQPPVAVSQISNGETTLSSPSHLRADDLLKAFVESAAIETFFLWDRYKKEWALQHGAGATGLQTIDPNSANGDDEDNPQEELQESGKIPDGFLRQMFYTLGDYKDILDGKNIVADILNGSSGSDKDIAEREKQIKGAIDKIFPNSGNKEHGGQTRESWWNENAKYIWEGMVCALTYKEDGAKGGTALEEIDEVKKALMAKLEKETGEYHYDKVVLKEDESGPKPAGDTQPPTLKQFTSRPPYFRYLEEWGETFCKERKKRLEQIKVDCMEEDGTKQKYSGDGEECEKVLVEEANTFKDLEYRTCAKPCRWYRKWIERKKYEFTEQYNAYGGQKNNYKTESNCAERNDHGNRFCETLTKCTDAAKFLKRLRPCKKDNGGSDITFDDSSDTFKHTQYCGTCSQFKIKCENCNSSGGNTQVNCSRGTITAENINNSTDINMLVSDNSGNGFQNVLDACGSANIFKGFREDVWECGNVCGYEVCKPKEGNRENVSGKANGENPIITITALVTHWVQNFLDDYKKIKHKISHCTKTDQGSTCQNKCQNKCKCVGEWIKLKQQEWEKIKDRFLKQYKNDNSDEDFNLRSCLETFLLQIGAAKDKDKVIKLSKFEDSKGCCASANVQKDSNQDTIECMLDRLQQKIEECKRKPGENSVQNIGQQQAQCQNPSATPEPDEEDLLLEEEEEQQNPDEAKKKMMPTICNIDEPTKPEEDDEKCDPAEKKDEKKDEKKEESEVPAEEESGAIGPGGPPAAEPKPAPIPPLVTSTLAWSVGIGFATFTYFYLK
ncbi:hypothetical protein PFMC_06042, partial [Plasmodium falciparum CAMP/Malaysia]